MKKPMPIDKYIDKMNRLYGSSTTDEYGNEESATDRIREQAKYKRVPNNADKKLIKWALEESPEPIVKNPVMKKAIAADNDPAAGAKYIDWWDR